MAVSGEGEVDILDGTVVLNTDLTLPNLKMDSSGNGGTLTGSGNLTVSGNLNWFKGTMSGTGSTKIQGTATIAPPDFTHPLLLSHRSLDVVGTASAYGLNLDGAIVSVETTGTWNSLGNYSLTSNATSTFNNNGIFNGDGTFGLGLTFNNTGTGQVNANGNLKLLGGGANDGMISVTGSGNLEYDHGTSKGSIDVGVGASAVVSDLLDLGPVTVSGLLDVKASSFGATSPVRVQPSAILKISTSLPQAPNAPESPDDDTTTFDGTVTMTGATLEVDGGTVNFSNDVTMGSLVLSGGTLGGSSNLTVSGRIVWTGGTMAGSGATNANGGLFLGSGSEILDHRTLNNAVAAVWQGNGGSFTQQNGSTFNNQSSLDIQNSGNWNSDASSTFNNQGVLEKSTDTGTTTFGVTVNNSGEIAALTGILDLSGGLSNFDGVGTLTGGNYFVTGILQFTGANIQTDAANIVLNGTGAITDEASNNALANLGSVASGASLSLQGSSLTTNGDVQNAGTVSIDATSTLTSGGNYIQSGGSTFLNGGTLAATTTDLQSGQLFGTGTINGDVQNAGTVLIGTLTGAAGTLTINGNYTQLPLGALTVQIGGPNAGTDFDQLVVNGNATVGGALYVTLVHGYSPTSGTEFPVLVSASESGTFAGLGGDSSRFTVNYVHGSGEGVTLTAN